MARIPYPDPASLPEIDRRFLESLPQLNISRLIAGSPSIFQPLTRLFSAYLNDGEMSPEMREIVILRVAYRLNSDYELFNHKRAARVIGMAEERITAVLSDDPGDFFDEQELLIMRFVDEVLREGAASEEVFRALEKSMPLSKLIELSVVIGVYTMVAQICATFEIEREAVPIDDSGLQEIARTVKEFR